jgi:monoamine oxidase
MGEQHGDNFRELWLSEYVGTNARQGGRSGILNDFAGGSTVHRLNTKAPFARMSKQVLRKDAKSFLNSVTPVFPGLAPLWNGKATISIPHLLPLFNCAYSYWKVGQYQSFAGYEKIRQKNVFFAGEHTSLNYQGYMEGGCPRGRAGCTGNPETTWPLGVAGLSVV